MHIVHVVQLYHPVASGSVRYFSELGKRLAAAGHRVTVLTTTAHDLEALWQAGKRTLPAGFSQHEGCGVWRFAIHRFTDWPLFYPLFRRVLCELGRLPLPVAWVRRLAAITPACPDMVAWLATHADEIDVIHVTNVTLDGLIHPIMQLAQVHQIPVLCTPFVHLGEIHDRAFVRYYSMPQQLDILQRSTDVCAMTNREAQFLRHHGVTTPMHTIGAGVTPDEVTGGDAQAFRMRHQITGAICLQVGAMARDKGTITTVQAMQQLWANGVDVTLVLIGAPLAHFSAFLDTLPPSDRTRMRVLAYASDAERRDAYAAADVFMLPSRTDSFGIVFLEAWCNLVPVIGADAGGIPDVVSHEVNGLLVPFADVHCLVAAVMRLLTDRPFAQVLARRGYESVMAHDTWEHVFARISVIYDKVVPRHAD